VLDHSLSNERSARAQDAQALAVIADPQAQRVPLKGADGTLVVTPSNEAALVVRMLPAAPNGKTYEAWVIHGKSAAPAGLFSGGQTAMLRLDRPVQPGETVGVTVERAGGVDAPTSAPIITATT
jgi:hypothetical protein